MYTLLGILSVGAAAAAILFVIIWIVHNGTDNIPNSYDSVTERFEKEARKKRVKDWRVYCLATIVLFFAIALDFISSRSISKADCENNEGQWKSWDNGMRWECFDPSDIPADNNMRVIIAEDEE